VKEIQLATEIEHRYSKDKILEMYLNTIYFGAGLMGSRRPPGPTSVSRSASSTWARPRFWRVSRKGPAVFPVYRHQACQGERDIVLGRMQTLGTRRRRRRTPPERAGDPEPFFKGRGLANYFVDFARKDLEPRYGRALLTRGGCGSTRRWIWRHNGSPTRCSGTA